MEELADECCQPCDLLSERIRQDQWEEWLAASAEERVALEPQWGINSWYHGFLGVPGISKVYPASIVPFDWMHVGPEGMLKHEFAAFMFVAIKRECWFTFAELKLEWDSYPWPPGQGAPPFPSDTFLMGRKIDGQSGSFPKANIHFHWTASQVRT